MDLDKLDAFLRYRREHPPAGLILKQLVDGLSQEENTDKEEKSIKPQKNKIHKKWDKSTLDSFMNDFTSAGGAIKQ